MDCQTGLVDHHILAYCIILYIIIYQMEVAFLSLVGPLESTLLAFKTSKHLEGS